MFNRRSRTSALVAFLLLAFAGSAVAQTGSDDERAARAAFSQAVAAFDRGDDDVALRGFTELRRSYRILDDYHLHYLGRIHLRRGDAESARRAFAQLLVDSPASLHIGHAALELGRIVAAEKDFVVARRYFERAVYSGDAATADAARFELAKVAFSTTDARTAYAAFAELRGRSRGSEVGRMAKQYVMTLRTQEPQLAPQGRALLDEIDLLLAERDFNAARHLAGTLADAAPELRPQALRRRADALFGLGDVDEAFATLWEVVDKHPNTEDAPQVLYRLATLLWNRDRDAAAKRAFERYLKLYPRHAKVVDARYAIARIEAADGKIEVAKQAYHSLIRAYPSHALAAEARWRLGWLEYRRGEWWEAAKAFAALAEDSSGRDYEAAMYWRGRCHQRLGNSDRARATYAAIAGRRSYYGMWAQSRIRQLAGGELPALNVRRLAAAATVAVLPPLGSPPSGIDRFHWIRFVELDAARLPALAHAELAAVEAAAEANADVRRFLLSAYRRVDRHDEALRLMNRLGSAAGMGPAERRRALYPLAFWDQVRDEGHQRQVDPLLVLALMRQESAFNPVVRSPANAVGLMQVLPSTAERLAANPAVAGTDPTRLTDPQTSIRLGTFYLGKLLNAYGGSPYKALAAYNGGEAAVAKWEQRWPNAEPDEFVDSISFRETRDYVKKVIGNYLEYIELYGG